MKLKLGEGLQIPIEVAGQAVALVGIRGSGKTNTAGVIAEELLDRGQPIVVLDPTDAWWGLRSDYPVFIFGGPHGDLPLNETDGKTLAEFVVQEKVPIILSLRHLRKGAQRRLVMEFCEELYHLKGKPEYREPLTVFIDEAPQFVPQRVMGEMARLVGAVQDMILLGRNAGFGVVLISQRFATLNADVRTQADTVIVHRLPSPLDRKALTEWIEENATLAEQKEVLSSLAMLKTGEAWIWAPYFDLFKRAQIRARKTFDSSAAPKRGAPARAPKDLTKVDLEKLKGKLAATIEKAKADDPRELRKAIAAKDQRLKQLEAELAKPARNIPENMPAKDKPVLTDADRARLEKVGKQLTDIQNEIAGAQVELLAEHLKSAEDSLRRVWGQFEGIHQTERVKFGRLLETKGFQKILDKLARVEPQLLNNHEKTQPFAGRRAEPPARAHASSRRPSTTPAAAVSHDMRSRSESGAPADTTIKGGKFRAMLVALAQAERPLSDSQVAARAVMSLSGTFDKYLGQQRTNGWVTGERSALSITDDGLLALGAYDQLPVGIDLQNHWLSMLGNGKKHDMLAVLIAAYPVSLTDAVVAERAQMALSGTFDKYLGQLRTLQLVEGSRQALRASEELFS